jgi:S-formylglutathione hydrolase FrmB
MKTVLRAALLLGFLMFAAALCAAQSASRVECATYQSVILARAVPYCVMLPPAYAEQTRRRFPVSYYLHGLGDNEQSLIQLGGWAIYDRLLHEKKIGDLVLIAPAGFTSFYLNSRDGSFRYEDFFLHEFMPAMEKKYRVSDTRAHRGVMGVSMGGFGALHYGFKYPDKFAVVSANMPALIPHLPNQFSQEWQRRLMSEIYGDPPDQKYYEQNSVFHLARTIPPGKLKGMTIYFDCGAQDRYHFDVGTEALDELLTSEGVRHESHIYPGGHNWPYVLEHLAASLEAQSRALGAQGAK